MAETRRSRIGQTTGASRSYAFDEGEEQEGDSPRHQSLSLRVPPTIVPTSTPRYAAHRMTPHLGSIPDPVSPPRTQFWDRGREQVDQQLQTLQNVQTAHSLGLPPQAHSLALECIQEGIASSWGSSFDFPPIHSLPVTSTLHRRQGTSSFSAATPHIPYTAQGTAHEYTDTMASQSSQFVHATNPVGNAGTSTAMAPAVTGMAIQSCPASIHTSPVMRPASTPQSHPAAHNPFDLLPSFMPSPLFGPSHPQQLPPIVTNPPAEYALQSAPPPLRLTDSTAIDPFGFNFCSPIHGQSAPVRTGHAHHRDSVASALSALLNLSTPSSATDQRSVLEWRGGTIDPRWVSPGGSACASAWTTPAVTPRSGSPVSGPIPVQGLIGPGASAGTHRF